MPPARTTKPNLSSGFTPFGGPERGSAISGHQDSARTANTYAGPSWSGHGSRYAVPGLPPGGSSAHQRHEFWPATGPSRSGNNIVAISQYSALLTPSNRYLLQHPPRPPPPAQQFYEPTSGTHGCTTSLFPGTSSRSGPLRSHYPPTHAFPVPLLHAGASTSQFHQSQPPDRPSRTGDNIIESPQSAASALWMPGNEHVEQPSDQPFPAPHWSYDHPAVPRVQDSPRQRPLPPLPALQSCDNPPAFGAHDDPKSFLASTRGRSEPSWSDHPPTRTAPDILLPVGNPTPQHHGSLAPIYPSRSENNIGESSHPAALSMPHNENIPRQHSHSPLPSLQSFDNPAASGAHGGATAYFTGASGFQVGEFKVVNVNSAGDRSIDGWELLLKKAAPNALHNSSVRYDAPKCDEDTRVEVTSELMEWIEDRNAPQRLLCMTGAAGSGKSCLQQTAAEKCAGSDILAASFFLSAGDPTRNTVEPVIPTIAYQLGRRNESLKWLIKTTIERDSLIFSQSLEAQATALIVGPVKNLRNAGNDLRSLPYVILIDGLDEAKGEDRQAELLTAIRRCLLVDNLPFRIFIASRPELAIHTALQPGGHLRDMAYHIQLSDKYDATADMRRYLQRRFGDIGLRINDPNWFSEDNIETLVHAGSGQFIYVATVYKYISTPRTSPAARLKIILTWTPREGQATRPFEVLDRLYTNILLDAKNAYEAVDSHHGRDFLLLFRTYHMEIPGFVLGATVPKPEKFAADVLSALLSLEPRGEETLISDLRCLVAFKPDRGWQGLHLHLYHKSFSDFLEEPSRAKDLFVPESRVYTHLAKCLMQHIIKCLLDLDSLPAKWEELPLSKLHRESLGRAVFLLPFSLGSARNALDEDEVVGFTQNGGWQKVDNLVPLLYRFWGWFYRYCEEWISAVREISDHLKERKPETAAVIIAFAKKWGDARKQWKKEYR